MRPFKSLLGSRKFWVAVATVVGTGLSAAGGGVGPAVVAAAKVAGWVGPILIATIAGEDMAEKWGRK